MNLKLETEFSKAPILQEVDALKRQIDEMRPLPEDVEGRVMQKLRLDWNYHSNAIEGNKLSYGETVAFLMEGITAKGKPLKDHLDIRGHNEAINFLLSIVKDARLISESEIRSLHKMILVEPYMVDAQTADGSPTTKLITLGEYKTSANHVKTATGEMHYYSTPEETPAKMEELMEWYREANASNNIHPVVAAALFHHKFVAIHPFDDGNGRLSRILMNLILMQKGYPPVVVKMDDRINYYSLLSRADNGDGLPFIDYVGNRLESSLQLYLKGVRGEDINEEDDIDKAIALFKIRLKKEMIDSPRRTNSIVLDVIHQFLEPLFNKLLTKISQFDDFFNAIKNRLEYVYLLNNSENRLYYNVLDARWVDLSVEFHEIKSIIITCILEDFKASESFNAHVSWQIDFNSYDFTVFDYRKNEILKKTYDDLILERERRLCLRVFIENLQNVIDKQVENNIKNPQ